MSGGIYHDFKDMAAKVSMRLAEANSFEKEVVWLRSVLEDLPLSIGEDGLCRCTLSRWLADGPAFAAKKWAQLVGVILIDRFPYYNKDRDLWYFYRYHGGDQFSPECASYINPTCCPSAWDMPPDKVCTEKRYHDDTGISGWGTSEAATEALNRGAILWAKNNPPVSG